MMVNWKPIASAYVVAIVVAVATVAIPALRELSWDATFKIFLYVPASIAVGLTLFRREKNIDRSTEKDNLSAVNAIGTETEVHKNDSNSRRKRLLVWGINFGAGWITAFWLILLPVHLYFK
jgi:hypothetical protein